MIIPMWKPLRRWHFDLAFFVGQAIFSWAYWYTKPQPLWTVQYSDMDGLSKYSLTAIGFSADSQSIYTTRESHALSKDWAIPQIQRWDARTGELLEDYPIEMPKEDRFQLQLPRQNLGRSYTVTLCTDPSYFLLQYHQSKEQDHHYLRLYRIDGKPIGTGIELDRKINTGYLSHQSVDQSHWGLFVEHKSQNEPIVHSFIDFDTGKTLLTFPPMVKERVVQYQLLPNRHSILFVKSANETNDKSIDVIDLQNGESRARFPLPPGNDQHLAVLDDTHWAIVTRMEDHTSSFSRLDVYRYDPDAKTLKADPFHPLNGFSSKLNQAVHVMPPYLLLAKSDDPNQNNPEWFKVALGWLARIGIVRDGVVKTKYEVLDLATGQLLRQVTGIHADVCLFSPDLRYLVEIKYSPKQETGLCLYRIPHHLWEPTLSWMQWLAWLLVIPWPLRYFVQPHLAPGSSSRGTSR
jgi:hypothetical protein